MALPSEDLVRYSEGQVAVGGGKLRNSIMASFSYDNGATMKHSMLKKFNGIVMGVPNCQGSIEVEVDDSGPERDFFGDVQKGKAVKFQFEIPTLNVEIEGVYKTLDGSLPMGDAVKLTLGWIGKMKEGVKI